VKESDLKKQIKKDLPEGAWHFSPVSMGMGKSGIPDILICIPMQIKKEDVGKTFGLFVGIEAKMFGKKPTKLQQMQLEDVAAAGGVALVATQTVKKEYEIRRIR
jgi:hypothetical protein